ncbi:transglycosylase SLT domain-containing protein [Cupriavidus sp. OTU4054]|uniref:transglycosylase SLT domain-containing protein n=1 Tax=Cupriavidus sp. OTU4054 TaxID=3043853 RepID=UPI00313C6CD2
MATRGEAVRGIAAVRVVASLMACAALLLPTLARAEVTTVRAHGVTWLQGGGAVQPIRSAPRARAGGPMMVSLTRGNDRDHGRPDSGPAIDSASGSNIRAHLGPDIRASIGPDIRANLGPDIRANLGPDIRTSIGPDIRANLGPDIRTGIGPNIRANLGPNIRANLVPNLVHNIGSYSRSPNGPAIRPNTDPGSNSNTEPGSDPDTDPDSEVAAVPFIGLPGLASMFPAPAPRTGDLLRTVLPFVTQAASDNRLDPALLLAVIHAESGFNPAALSPKGAVGLMQLMPATAGRYGEPDPRDPARNVRAGAAHLRYLIGRYGDLPLALAAYNAGEGAVERHGLQIPPYAETQQYVPRVMALYRGYQARLPNPLNP